ncbi:MAG: ATP synthase subunit I [Casimicrobiaceae bacterium]
MQGPQKRDVKTPPPTPAAHRRRPGHPRAEVFATLVSRPIRTVLAWQALASVACALGATFVSGGNAGWSAAMGGMVTLASTVAYALMLGAGEKSSAGASVATMLRAEAVKIVVVMGGLWLVLTRFSAVVPLALLVAFVVTVLLFSVALLSRS